MEKRMDRKFDELERNITNLLFEIRLIELDAIELDGKDRKEVISILKDELLDIIDRVEKTSTFTDS